MERWGQDRIDKGLCRYCGKFPIANTETNKCESCANRPTTIEIDDSATMNPHERLEVAIAIQQQLEARLYSTMRPELMLDHAAGIEKQAFEMLAQARKIRYSLQRDILIQSSLRKQVKTNKIEIAVLRYMIQQKVPIARLRFVVDYMERMIAYEEKQQKPLVEQEAGSGI